MEIDSLTWPPVNEPPAAVMIDRRVVVEGGRTDQAEIR